MVSYTKHLVPIMIKAGVDPRDYENRRLLDKAVREVLDMERADAEDVWQAVKPIVVGDSEKRKEFENKVAKVLVKLAVTG